MCLDRKTGSVLWDETPVQILPHEGHHRSYGSFASGSPFIDGDRVYVSFGSRGLYCYDFEGNLVWKRDLAKMKMRNAFGEGSSPIVYGNVLVTTFDHEGESFIAGLNKETGNVLWETPRPTVSAWSTPVVVEVDGKPQVVTTGTPAVRGYDLATGKELWHCDGMTTNAIPSVVYGQGLIFAASGFRGNALFAIRPGGTGDLTGDAKSIAWSLDRGTSYVPSPMLYGDELYLLEDSGTMSCYDARTGKAHYARERLPDGGRVRFHSSPVGAGDKIYLVDGGGTCVVLKRGPKLEVLGVNPMEERFNASPAVAAGDLFLRGSRHLFCIGVN